MTDMPLTLSTAPFEHPAMDYDFLRAEGIRHLERLGGQLWTDFNTHDPGITILEQVCYALTDLAYRINYDLPDLLYHPDEPLATSLYSPAQILTSHPVTPPDLRKLLIDIPGVKNAWVEKVTAPALPLYYHHDTGVLSLQGDDLAAEPLHLKGLYRVLIELSDVMYLDANIDQRQAAYREAVYSLHAYRGLCEDFETIQILDPERIQVHARVEIEPVDDAEAVLLKIYQAIAAHISPPVPFYGLSELLAAGKRVDEIFDGPLLQHGFIDAHDLSQAQRRTVLRTSDLIQEIMDVPGVLAVRSISASKGGKSQDWSLELDPNSAPKLDIENSTITLERNQLVANVDVQHVRQRFYRHLRDAAYRVADDAYDLDLPRGQERRVGNYHSIQHQFPATYGIGALGLPASASAERKAQAKQLQAYLMFFDQLLANYFEQLAHVRDLFSFSEQTARTYFSRPLDDPALGLDGIRRRTHTERLQLITENPHGETTLEAIGQTGFERRNRFLNHLLAYFAEQFTDYSLILYGAMAGGRAAAAGKLATDKQQFLQDYPILSSARGTGHNYLLAGDSTNISGLEQRIRRKLGIVDAAEFFYVVEHILLRPMTGDEDQQVPFLVDPAYKDPLSLRVSFVFPEWPSRFKDSGFRTFAERTVREETPVHLIPTVHWLDRPSMQTFEVAHKDWLARRRDYWQNRLGV